VYSKYNIQKMSVQMMNTSHSFPSQVRVACTTCLGLWGLWKLVLQEQTTHRPNRQWHESGNMLRLCQSTRAEGTVDYSASILSKEPTLLFPHEHGIGAHPASVHPKNRHQLRAQTTKWYWMQLFPCVFPTLTSLLPKSTYACMN